MTYKGKPICLTADSSGETLLARMEWEDIFKVLQGKNLQPRWLYLEMISFKIDRDIKSFSDKQKLREFSTTKPAIQFSSVQSLSRVRLFATPWIAALQASLSIINSRSLLKLMSIESVMPSSHLILCHCLLLLPPIPPSNRVFSNESTLCMR